MYTRAGGRTLSHGEARRTRARGPHTRARARTRLLHDVLAAVLFTQRGEEAEHARLLAAPVELPHEGVRRRAQRAGGRGRRAGARNSRACCQQLHHPGWWSYSSCHHR